MSPTPRQPNGASDSVHPVGATPSQLDIIAEINERAARQHWGRRAWRIATLMGGAVLLAAALWWSVQGGTARAPASPLPAAAVPTETLRDSPAAVAQAPPAASAIADPASPDRATAAARGALAASARRGATAMPLAETVRADSRARNARADALQLQQERSRVEGQERQQLEAEREAQLAREQADAASRRAAEQVPAPAQPVAEPKPGVRELCSASSNIISENFCHSRECRKPERANDAICMRLREIEQARTSGGQ